MKKSLLLLCSRSSGLLCSLGDFASTSLRLVDSLDHTHSHGLPHVTNGESSKWRVVSEGLDTEGLSWDEFDDSGVSVLQSLRVVLNLLSGTTVDLLLELGKLAGNVSSVAIKHRAIASSNLSRMVHDDHLSGEGSGLLGRVALGVRANRSTSDVLDRNVLDVETNIVSRPGLREGLVVHLNGFHLSGDVLWGESDDHSWLDESSLHTADGHSSDTTDLVDVLEGKSEWLVGWACGCEDRVQGIKKSLSAGVSLLASHLPSLEPRHVGGGLKHVVSVESGNWHEWNGVWVVSDLLDEAGDLSLDLSEASLREWWFGGVHLVASDDELLHSKGLGKKSVFTGLSVLGDSGLELSGTTSDNQHGTIGLRGSCDHVLDEITMSRGVDDGDVVLGGLELPESNVNGDTTLTLGLQFVQHPGVLEGSLAHLLSFLLELLDGTLVNSTAFVDEMPSGGRLAGVDVSDDDNVDMNLFLSHC
jgi:hypothetical protein